MIRRRPTRFAWAAPVALCALAFPVRGDSLSSRPAATAVEPIVAIDAAADPLVPTAVATPIAAFDPAPRPAISLVSGPGSSTGAAFVDGLRAAEGSAGRALPPKPSFRIPEPASIVLIMTGVVGIAARRHLLKRKLATT